MKTIKTFEAHDMLGHEIHVGDWIQFQSGGLDLWGEITEITNDEKEKYVVKTLGWFGDKSLRNKIKETYKVNTTSKSVYALNKIDKNI